MSDAPGAGGTDSCAPFSVNIRNVGPLHDQCALENSEPSLQPHKHLLNGALAQGLQRSSRHRTFSGGIACSLGVCTQGMTEGQAHWSKEIHSQGNTSTTYKCQCVLSAAGGGVQRQWRKKETGLLFLCYFVLGIVLLIHTTVLKCGY